jgi:outer membrane lipoprotein SlyB
MQKPSSFSLPLLLLSSASLCLSGCVTESSDLPSYPVSSRGQASQVFEVVIVSANPVALRGESSVLGVATGGIAGGIAGSMIGQGRASALTAVGGALAGGLAGDAIERKVTSGRGVEIMVRTMSGQTWSVVQKDHGERFQPGEHVRMLVGPQGRTISR